MKMFRMYSEKDKKFYYFTVGQIWDDITIKKYNDLCLNGAKPEFYIGITDKNDKEMYQGDIIKQKYGEREYGIVEWVEHAYWIVEPSKTRHMPAKECREVVGNIHDNNENNKEDIL